MVDLSSLQKSLNNKGSLPPVDQWNPDFCGDIDLQIKSDGRWFYTGSPIGREAIVKLFASVIKKEQDNYFLVTPVEKVGIQVEDVPFIVTQWRQEQEHLICTTSVGDETIVCEQNPIALHYNKQQQDFIPYLKIRRNLWARLHQNVLYQLVELGVEALDNQQRQVLTIRSGEAVFPLGFLE